ncbi:hypothetical protein LTR84_003726 [Exophiala bonariae]|uniref:Tafazzin n=1 Tax=Exophiala bonariae TaxID=1690606 RepID=A0AAV9N8V0_9EURO|nr:hypothetical protein LTR84_003726 [Exophiala bonariae]
MPKKYQQKSLQIKPQSSSSHTLSLSHSSTTQQESSQRTVNDLIRDSRRQQLRKEQQNSPHGALTTVTAGSVPPSVRAVLDLPPPPPPPEPRVGVNHGGGTIRYGPGNPSPARFRRIPGPPPPRSWLTDSIHAPAKYKRGSNGEYENDGRRLQVRSSILPSGSFPPERSLQHLALKKIASNWAWHVEYEREYLAYLPLNLKETLLSYLAIYNELGSPGLNPLRILFLDGEQQVQEDRDEVQRLDLGNGLGLWTSLKGLEKDLVTKTVAKKASTSVDVQDSWDADDDSDDFPKNNPTAVPRVVHSFQNLKHLSLSISPDNTHAASWTSLCSLATELGTLSSLSLAYWPQPTFTPNAATTRAVVHVPGARPVVYGGTNIYSSLDNDWREAAGILRTLSRALYCLTWLDLTGCGNWWDALLWPSMTSSDNAEAENIGPEWNGGWRGLEKLVLHPGWKSIPPPPPPVNQGQAVHGEQDWNVEHERLAFRYQKEEQRLAEMERTAKRVATQLRILRKSCGGRWLDVDVGPAP